MLFKTDLVDFLSLPDVKTRPKRPKTSTKNSVAAIFVHAAQRERQPRDQTFLYYRPRMENSGLTNKWIRDSSQSAGSLKRHNMKIKRVKGAKKIINFYKNSFGIFEPYQVLSKFIYFSLVYSSFVLCNCYFQLEMLVWMWSLCVVLVHENTRVCLCNQAMSEEILFLMY